MIPIPYGVIVTSREDDVATYYFLLSLTEQPHENIVLPEPMQNLITEQQRVTRVSLTPLDVTTHGAEGQ